MKLMLVCHRFKNVFEDAIQYQSRFFTRIPRKSEEIQLHLNSQKRFVSMVISVEIDAEKLDALEQFWKIKGSLVKNVTIYYSTCCRNHQHLIDILWVVKSAENIVIECIPEEFKFIVSRPREIRQNDIKDINFEKMKSLKVYCECKEKQLIKPELLLLLNAPELKKISYKQRSRYLNPKFYQCLNKFKKLTNCEFSSSENELEIDITKKFLHLNNCLNGIYEIKKFFNGRFDLVKKLKFYDASSVILESPFYDPFLKEIVDHLTELDIFGEDLHKMCEKFKFPNVKKITLVYYNTVDEIDEFSRAVPNLEELKILNPEWLAYCEHELDLIRAHFKEIKKLEQEILQIKEEKNETLQVVINEMMHL